MWHIDTIRSINILSSHYYIALLQVHNIDVYRQVHIGLYWYYAHNPIALIPLFLLSHFLGVFLIFACDVAPDINNMLRERLL